MRRKLGWMVVLALLLGGAAACGDDDEGGDTGTVTTEAGDSGDSGGGGNEAIAAYCDSVQEVVDKSVELQDDPTNAELQQEVSDLTTQLATDAQALTAEVATFTAEEAEQFQACQTDLSGLGG